MYAVYLLFAKSLRGLNVRSTAVVFTQSAFTAAVMLVPGLLAVGAAHYSYTGIDLLMAALLGLVTTAFSFSLFMDGLHYIRVQHASIIAYVEPVSAPFYALSSSARYRVLDDRRRGADRRRRHPRRALRPRRARAGAAGMSGGRRDPAGYGLVIGSYLFFGLSATLVTWADAPESVLLVIRFALAAAVLLLVFSRRRPLQGVFRRGVWQRLLVMGALDAFTVIAYFFAVRAIGVAIATFFLFLQPVWVASSRRDS